MQPSLVPVGNISVLPELDWHLPSPEWLRQSVEIFGIVSPIVVTEYNDTLVIIDGIRRFRLAREFSLNEIPTVQPPVQLKHESVLDNLQMMKLHLHAAAIWHPLEIANIFASITKDTPDLQYPEGVFSALWNISTGHHFSHRELQALKGLHILSHTYADILLDLYDILTADKYMELGLFEVDAPELLLQMLRQARFSVSEMRTMREWLSDIRVRDNHEMYLQTGIPQTSFSVLYNHVIKDILNKNIPPAHKGKMIYTFFRSIRYPRLSTMQSDFKITAQQLAQHLQPLKPSLTHFKNFEQNGFHISLQLFNTEDIEIMRETFSSDTVIALMKELMHISECPSGNE